MAGHYPFSILQAWLSPKQRARSEELHEQKRLGILLCDLREKSRLTKSQLAEQVGVSRSTIARIEASGDMQVTTFKKIVSALGGRVVLQMPSGEIALPAAGE